MYAQHGGHDFGMFKQADADGDGRIDLDEWLELIGSWTKKGVGGQIVIDIVTENVQSMIANAKKCAQLQSTVADSIRVKALQEEVLSPYSFSS